MAPKRSRSVPGRGRELGRLVTSYSIAAGGVLACVADAGAAPIVGNILPVTLSRDGERPIIDLDGDRVGDFVVRVHNYLDGIIFDIISHVYESTGIVRNLVAHDDDAGGGLGVTVFERGQRIGPETTDWRGRYADANAPSLGVLLETDTPSGPLFDRSGFLGLYFDIPGGSYHFGYLEVEGTGETLTIRGGAYESEPNVPIEIPASVPEPGSLALLASGAVGLAAWRRARQRHT